MKKENRHVNLNKMQEFLDGLEDHVNVVRLSLQCNSKSEDPDLLFIRERQLNVVASLGVYMAGGEYADALWGGKTLSGGKRSVSLVGWRFSHINYEAWRDEIDEVVNYTPDVEAVLLLPDDINVVENKTTEAAGVEKRYAILTSRNVAVNKYGFMVNGVPTYRADDLPNEIGEATRYGPKEDIAEWTYMHDVGRMAYHVKEVLSR